MKKSLLTFALFFASVFLFAQVPYQRTCGTMDNLQRLKILYPDLAATMQQIENQTATYIANHVQAQGNTMQSVVTIPVVFHVVYKTAAQNISDAQCQAQLNQLNLDFARLNTDAGNTPAAFAGVAANTQVQFCLAVRDPNGNATTGVIHKLTTVTSFSSNDNVKKSANGGDNAWPADSYLNIWSCNLGGGLLGYAQFPGGPVATDGVVFLYSSIGSMLQPGTATPYNLGRTATHEIGHWLNLRHIWGDASCGDDFVNDTPTQSTSNFGCPSYPHKTCGNTTTGDMFMNYMDYTDDGCMNTFTAGQTTRMQALFGTNGSRVSLLSSLGCAPPSGPACGVPSGLSASAVTVSTATLNWTSVSGATGYNVRYRVNASATWTNTTATLNSKPITGLSSLTAYEFQVQTVCASGSSAFSSSSVFTTPAPPTCGVPSGLSAGTLTANSALLSWSAVSGAVNYSLQWKAASSANWTTVSGLTATSYSLTLLSACTAYQFQVQDSCSLGRSAYSTAASFSTTGCAITYCTSKGSNTTYEYISKVALGTISNTSGNNNGYADYTAQSTNLAGGSSNTITLTPGFASSAYREAWNVWIDYNHNGSFADAGEKVATGSSTTTAALSLLFTVPATALNGTARMRVQMQYNTAPSTSCTSFTYGEVEDYTVNVTGNAQRFASAESVTDQLDVFMVYPNPARDEVGVTLRSAKNEKSTIRVFDILGKVIHTEDVVAFETGLNDFKINLHEAVSGIYFVEFNNAANRIVKKLVIDK